MKTINKIILLLLVVITFSCDDVLEKNITDDVVQTIAPIEAAQVTTNTVNFQWNSLKGATKYRLQVQRSNQSIAIDSLVTKTNLNITLPTGQYKWKVRAENFGYQSVYSEPINFSMAVSSVLTGQQVVLTIPEDNIFTKATSLSLQWQQIPSATSYEVQVTTTGGNPIYTNNNVTTTSVVLNTTDISLEAKYQWRVIAKNSNNSTQTDVASRSFSIDRTAPSSPLNLKTSTISSGIRKIDFSWDIVSDNITSGNTVSPSVTYIFQYAPSNSFDTGLFTSGVLTNPTFSYTFSTSGTYYWRVKAIDKAQNEGAYSVISQIILN
jgi:hypothetical protein